MILALDYGEKNIGLALSDEEEVFSFPVDVISASEMEKDLFILEKKLPRFSKITEIILGLPRNLKNEDTPQTLKVRAFYQKLLQAWPKLQITLVDERMTSAQHMKNVHTAGGNSKQARNQKDKFEAALLLEYYITLRKNEKEIQQI
jgi:putative holliday junction resolvase